MEETDLQKSFPAGKTSNDHQVHWMNLLVMGTVGS